MYILFVLITSRDCFVVNVLTLCVPAVSMYVCVCLCIFPLLWIFANINRGLVRTSRLYEDQTPVPVWQNVMSRVHVKG